MKFDCGYLRRVSGFICAGFLLWMLGQAMAFAASANGLPQGKSDSVVSGWGNVLKELGLKAAGSSELLSPDEAFRFSAVVKDGNAIRVSWRIADGYYLYRSKFAFALADVTGIQLDKFSLPAGETKQDPEFGAVEVYHHDFEFDLPLKRSIAAAAKLTLRADFQGCADRGVCYPPIQKTVTLELPAVDLSAPIRAQDGPPSSDSHAPTVGECIAQSATGFVELAPESAQCGIVKSLKRDSLGLTLASFFGMGLLLAFTPCIFPMIPILSGIIVGHGHKITPGRGFMLSLAYVVASALAYTVFGVLAGLFGGNLQALLQEPWIISAFSGVFVLLALSMFGLFTLQLPGFLHDYLSRLSRKQHGGTLLGAAAMGALSALIVGPCVAAPLAGALIYIGESGDAWLGGVALFSLGMGMGAPLLLIGASAGSLLPRAGAWMNMVKAVFGVGLLAVAIWLMARVLPPVVILVLWALLLMVSAVYLGALDSLPIGVSGWRRLWKGLGLALLVQGVLILVGAASGGDDPMQPLLSRQAGANTGRPVSQALSFQEVHSRADVEKAVAAAKLHGRWVMLDFYADWCVSCKEMERDVFSDSSVKAHLHQMTLLRADVTSNSEVHTALMKHFGLVGPPAVLFFDPEGEERRAFRVVGYMEASEFEAHLQRLLK